VKWKKLTNLGNKKFISIAVAIALWPCTIQTTPAVGKGKQCFKEWTGAQKRASWPQRNFDRGNLSQEGFICPLTIFWEWLSSQAEDIQVRSGDPPVPSQLYLRRSLSLAVEPLCPPCPCLYWGMLSSGWQGNKCSHGLGSVTHAQMIVALFWTHTFQFPELQILTFNPWKSWKHFHPELKGTFRVTITGSTNRAQWLTVWASATIWVWTCCLPTARSWLHF
jgi:hypothetical protein